MFRQSAVSLLSWSRCTSGLSQASRNLLSLRSFSAARATITHASQLPTLASSLAPLASGALSRCVGNVHKTPLLTMRRSYASKESEAMNVLRDMLKKVEGGEAMLQYPFVTTLPVQWGEMDATGVVGSACYFRYAESGRIVCLNRLYEMIGQEGYIDDDGIGTILASAVATYKEPLTYPDELIIGVRHKEMGLDYVVHSCAIFSVTKGRIVAEVETRGMFYSYKLNKKAPIPNNFRLAVQAAEAQIGNNFIVHTLSSSQAKNPHKV